MAKEGIPLIYSNYSGGGAATVVKSFHNLGLSQPLLVSYANIADSFLNLIKNDMPPRLLGTAMKALAPELLANAGERERVAYVTDSYKKWKQDNVDQLTLNGVALADTAEAVLRNVDDPHNAAAVRDYLEQTPILSVQTLRFSKSRHIGLTASDIQILEYKGGRWLKADPLQ